MKENELLKVLSEFNKVYLSGPDGEVEIEPQMSIRINNDGADFEMLVSGYTIVCGGKERNVEPEKFPGIIKTVAFFENDEFKLCGIGAERKSYEKYLDDIDFGKISMEGLLEIYGDVADSFSLTSPYNDFGETGEIYSQIDGELAQTAADEIESHLKESLRKQLENCGGLPPFDELYASVVNEYEEYYRNNKEFAEAHGGQVFICDRFAERKTKYTEPSELWHVYHNVEFAANCKRVLEKMINSAVEKPLCAEIENENVLKYNLQDITAGFIWHCTVSGLLSKTFFFELNADTEKWLLRHKDDYDFETLQDLAFYKDGKALFSSCTHERFHNDLREVKNG